MRRSGLHLPWLRGAMASLVVVIPLASCVIETEPGPRKPLLRDTLRARASAAVASASASAPSPPTSAEPPLPVPPPPPDAFRACDTDPDCVAVLPNGCCQDGRNVALKKTLVDAYRATFTCPTDKPRCPMRLVLDRRVPVCDVATHSCKLVDAPGNDAAP